MLLLLPMLIRPAAVAAAAVVLHLLC